MIEFTVDVTELVALANAIPGWEAIVDDEIRRAMEESGMLLTTMVAARTPVNYGILRSSIEFPAGFEVRGSPLTELVGKVRAGDAHGGASLISPREYANYVEFGTRPHWPPIAPIKLWALRKFGDETLAWPIAAAIARRGTPGAHMFRRAWEGGGRTRVDKIFAQATVRATARMAKVSA